MEEVWWIWEDEVEHDLRDLAALKERLGVILKEHDSTWGKRPRFTRPKNIVNDVGVCQRRPVSENIYGWGWKQYVEQMNSAAEVCGHTTTLYQFVRDALPLLECFGNPGPKLVWASAKISLSC